MCFSQYSLILRRTHKGVTSLRFSRHLDQDCKSSRVKRDKKIKNIDICFKLFFERVPYLPKFFNDDGFYSGYDYNCIGTYFPWKISSYWDKFGTTLVKVSPWLPPNFYPKMVINWLLLKLLTILLPGKPSRFSWTTMCFGPHWNQPVNYSQVQI